MAESDPEAALSRNEIVRLFGTPDHTTGSVNEPRLTVEHGIEFNEKWVYDRPRHEPSRPKQRLIYWQRYEPGGRAPGRAGRPSGSGIIFRATRTGMSPDENA